MAKQTYNDFQAGDKFIFHKCKANKEAIVREYETKNFTIGKIYTLFASFGSLSFKDNGDDERDFGCRFSEGYKVTKIVD